MNAPVEEFNQALKEAFTRWRGKAGAGEYVARVKLNAVNRVERASHDGIARDG